MVTIFADGRAEFIEALNASSPGDTIKLAPGDYDDITLYSTPYRDINAFEGGVTITSADPDNPAQMMGLSVYRVSDVVFDNIDFDFTLEEYAKNVLGGVDPATVNHASPVVRVWDSENITFRNSKFEGEIAKHGVAYHDLTTPNPGGNVVGLPTGGPIVIGYSDDVTVEDSEITTLSLGIRVGSVDGLRIEGNDIHNLRTTPIGGADADNVVIHGNTMRESHARMIPGHDLDHADFIHFFSRGDFQDGPQTNFRITDNVMLQGAGKSILGIHLNDVGQGLGFENVLIEDNLIHNGDPQGMRLSNISQATIRNNTLLASEDGVNVGIRLVGGSHDVDVANNVLHYLSVEDAYEIRESNNFLVQRADSTAPNYYGDLFVDPVATSPDADDLRARPDGRLEQLGVGARTGWFPDTSAAPIGAIGVEAAPDLASLVHSFGIESVVGATGPIDLTGASYLWRFGDGQTATGAAPVHDYTAPGLYEAGVDVHLADGRQVAISRTVDVEGPVALALDAAAGVADQTVVANPHEVTGDPVVTVGDRRAFDLRREITYATDDELKWNEAYTVTFDFRASGSGAAPLVLLPASFTLNLVDGDGIFGSVTGYDAEAGHKKTEWIQLRDIPIEADTWHNITLTFSGESGESVLYLDGNPIFEATGFQGYEQYSIDGKKVQVGGAGADPGHHVDDVYMVRGAFDAAQVARIAQGETVEQMIAALSAARASDGSGPDGPPPSPAPEPEQGYEPDRVALELDAESGLEDLSPTPNAYDLVGDAPIVYVGGRKALDLREPVHYHVDADLTGNEAFTVSMDFFSADAGQTDGWLFALPGSFAMSVEDGSDLWGSLTTLTPEGQKQTEWIRLSDRSLDDGAWHNVTMTFSGVDGTAVVYVDGIEAYRTDDLEGHVQYNVTHKKVEIGRVGDDRFFGDDVLILREALGAEEVAAIAAANAPLPADPGFDAGAPDPELVWGYA